MPGASRGVAATNAAEGVAHGLNWKRGMCVSSGAILKTCKNGFCALSLLSLLLVVAGYLTLRSNNSYSEHRKVGNISLRHDRANITTFNISNDAIELPVNTTDASVLLLPSTTTTDQPQEETVSTSTPTACPNSSSTMPNTA